MTWHRAHARAKGVKGRKRRRAMAPTDLPGVVEYRDVDDVGVSGARGLSKWHRSMRDDDIAIDARATDGER